MIEKSINDLTTVWQQLVNEPEHKTLTYPLSRIIKAWQRKQNTEHITPQSDAKHPVAVIKKGFETTEVRHENLENVAALPGLETPPKSVEQLEMPFMDLGSDLPVFSHLLIPDYLGLPKRTKSGAVSMPVRIFFEMMMTLEPSETKKSIEIRLGDLISYLYPDGNFQRRNQLKYVIGGLQALQWALIPYTEKVGGRGLWIPVRPQNLPTIESGDDFPIQIDVTLPPDATMGMMVEKEILRKLGKESLAKFSANLSACKLWDTHGTMKRGLINPTRPQGEQDSDGFVIHPETGNRIYDYNNFAVVCLKAWWARQCGFWRL